MSNPQNIYQKTFDDISRRIDEKNRKFGTIGGGGGNQHLV